MDRGMRLLRRLNRAASRDWRLPRYREDTTNAPAIAEPRSWRGKYAVAVTTAQGRWIAACPPKPPVPDWEPLFPD